MITSVSDWANSFKEEETLIEARDAAYEAAQNAISAALYANEKIKEVNEASMRLHGKEAIIFAEIDLVYVDWTR